MTASSTDKIKRIKTIIIDRAALEADNGPLVPDKGPALDRLAGSTRLIDDWIVGRDIPVDQAPETVALVSHTSAGIRAGLTTGCWVVGLALTGALADRAGDPPMGNQLAALLEATGLDLARTGAHFVADSIADLSWIIEEIDARLAEGETV